MPAWRWSAPLSAALAVVAPLHAHADPYQFVFSGNSGQTIRFDSINLATILPGVPTTIRGVGDTEAAVESASGGATVRTLALDELTFAGLPVADRVLRHTVTAAGSSSLCMAGTCVELGSAMPASWWNAPTPLDLAVSPGNVSQATRTIALQPGARAALGGQAFDIGSAGGTIEYGWELASFAPPVGSTPLRALVAPVPEPGTMVLFGAALFATAGVASRRRRS